MAAEALLLLSHGDVALDTSMYSTLANDRMEDPEQIYRATPTPIADMEEIGALAEAAGLHICKLDLEECLQLDDWHACYGTFMMPSTACLKCPDFGDSCVSWQRLVGA